MELRSPFGVRVVAGVLLAVLFLFARSPGVEGAKRTLTFRSGPYVTAGFESQFLREVVRSSRMNGSVVWMHARLVDRQGRPVSVRDAMLHDVFFVNLARHVAPGHCSARRPEIFYGTGEENQSLDLPDGYGYRLRATDRWRMGAMLMSHARRAKTVYVEYRVRVHTAVRKFVRPFWVRASGCSPWSSYGIQGDGAPGSIDERVEHGRVPLTGRIVAAGGHLHAGAIDLRMTQPACITACSFTPAPAYAPADAPVFRARPVLHEVGLAATSWFSSISGIPVRKGEVLDLTGVYPPIHAPV